jgi:CHAT domain-containing protein
MTDARLRGVMVTTATAFLVAAAIVGTNVDFAALTVPLRARLALERLNEQLPSEQFPVARFSALKATGARASARGAAPVERRVAANAGKIIALAEGSSSPDTIAAAAAAFAVNREAVKAIPMLEAAVARLPNDARLWNDLAAARYEANRLLPALVAADHALRVEPRSVDALHNRALVLERIGLPTLASEAWQTCLAAAPDAVLAQTVRERLKTSELLPESERWTKIAEPALLEAAAAGDHAAVDRITREHPRSVRTSAEILYLDEWVKAFGGEAEERSLRILRNIGGALERRGDTFVADAVRAIDEAAVRRDTDRLTLLVSAQRAYFRGRSAFKVDDYALAEKELRQAIASFNSARSPMEWASRVWLASVLIRNTRAEEAREILLAVVAAGPQYPGHRALLGHSEFLLSICETFRGRWDAAADAAKHSIEHYRDLGELSEAANSEGMLAAILDLLGQHDTAWQYRVRSFRAISEAGVANRLLVMLGGGSRAAVLAGDPDLALSFLDMEMALAAEVREPLLTADMLTRRVLVQHQRGASADRDASLARARLAVGMAKDSRDREKQTIELDAAEALILRDRNPRRAEELLGRAIEFARTKNLRFQLPGVLLQRGRAYVAAGDDDQAWLDFSAAMDELEAQRGQIDDVALRSRMLDTAEELFDEAISLQVRRGNAETAFTVAEHARARSLLDVAEGSPQPLSSSSAVASRLAPGTLLLEYAVLPEQLVIFAIRNDGMKMHSVKVRREELASHADLASLLLSPVRDDVAAATSLIVVPEKSLQRVSFSALRWNGTYLVQSHALSIAPSASRLAASRAVRKPQDGSILLVGNPAADEERNLEHLPAVEREIEAIRSFYGPARLLLHEEATRARFTEEAPKYDVIHFAGHGMSDDGSLTAALLFARGERDSGRMEMDDIAALHLPRAPLVVLSACGTLRGRVAGVEGMPSLARSFLAAGASAVVGTLTNVDDARAAELLTSFHRHMRDGATAAEALRTAQKEAISRGGSAADPRQWAQFVVYTVTP